MREDGPLSIVSAWSEANRVVLGAVDVPEGSNEIPAIEDLLNLLTLRSGDIVTIDAIGCQKSIVSGIRGKGADYVIALKRNHPKLAAELENFFDQALSSPEYAPCDQHGEQEKGRGREDSHEIWTSSDIGWLPDRSEWAGLSSVIMISRRWLEKGKERSERRYYISSLREPPKRLGEIIRRHWSIENELHWQLDITFQEDASQISALANKNLRVARMTALQLLADTPSILSDSRAQTCGTIGQLR